MSGTLAEIGNAVRDVIRTTFVIPVQEGRPRPAGWPQGLRALGLATAAVFALLALAILFAVPLRQYGDLTLAPPVDSLPAVSVPLLLVGVLLSLIMASTAALHAPWWMRCLLLVLTASVVVFFAVRAYDEPLLLWVSAAAYLALVVFTFLRARRDYAWWELVVVAALVLCATLAPWLVTSDVARGVDFRAVSLKGALVTLQPLIIPAVMVAGSAPAQIVVTGAQATASRPVGRGVFVAGFVVTLGWLVAATWQGVGTDALAGPAMAAAGVALVVVAAVTAGLLARARFRTPPQPQHYPEVWGAWLYPLAAAISLSVVLTLPVIILREFGGKALGNAALGGGLDLAINFFLDNNPGLFIRGAVGVVTWVIAWRLSARSRLTEAVALGAFGTLVLLDLLGLVPGLRFLQDRSVEALGLLASAVALVAALAAVLRRRFDRGTAVGVMTVVLLALLYPHRNLLSDPVGFALAFSGPVVLVFGLAWRVITEAQITSTGSRRYPQATRVLLFLANALFATTGVAYLALARGLGTDADPTLWGELGDVTLGDPLYLTGLVAGLWLVLRPERPAPAEPVPLAQDAVTQPRQLGDPWR